MRKYSPPSVACVTNCIDVQRDYSGAGTGQADLQINSPVSCHVIVEFTGNFTVHLTIHPNNTVNGTVSVNGTAKIIQIIQPSNPFCQLASLPISVNNAPITGTVDNMTATLSVAGFSGVLIGHITGNTLLGQVQTPAPENKVLLNFSLTPL